MNAPRQQSWLLAALLLSACTPMSEPRIQVGTVPGPGYEPFFLAREPGLLPAQRLQRPQVPWEQPDASRLLDDPPLPRVSP
ncbi:hypothetical protein [Archangium sp.]|uniref:hypothetical protein n=1 Tax=Archangium sp. TaxID=1872627 RepID=UPI002D5AD332|nr:hypothetical protein [Archangium sp.]HYO52855.1 hypothetical protein [Archangium sp.]